MALEGKQLGRYRILHLLGSGGMGDVYLAEDARIKQQVALKVIWAEQTPYPNAQGAQHAARLFEREARAIGQLDHPNILPLYDYGEEPEGKTTLIYLVMPYRPEGSVVDWVRQHSPDRLVPPNIVAHLVGQSAEALQHAHDHQIIHQDVKPSNFLIRANPKTPARPDLLLSDFGIAHITTATASTSQTIRGTPTYMSPEQCVGKPVPASDQYALAIMAYELLTGHPPFQGNQMQIMFQHVHQAPEPPSTLNPRLSAELDDVILTALTKRPEERFASVTAFATALQNAVQAMEMANAPTRSSTLPLPRTTALLPDTPLISETMANAPTNITPTEASHLTMPLPETLNLGRSNASSPVREPAAPARNDGVTGPTAPQQPETLDLEAVRAAARPSRSGLVEPGAPVPAAAPPAGGRKTSRLLWLLIAAAVLVLLALVAGGAVYTLPSLFSHPQTAASSATVTLTPASKNVQNTFTLSAVTGTPDASKQQVGARLLSVTTPAQTKTVNATGQESIPGTHASGTLFVYNCDTANPLTLSAGSTFQDNNGDPSFRNIIMVLDAKVTLPASACQPGYAPRVCVTFLQQGSGE